MATKEAIRGQVSASGSGGLKDSQSEKGSDNAWNDKEEKDSKQTEKSGLGIMAKRPGTMWKGSHWKVL